MKVLFDCFWWSHGPASLRNVSRSIVGAWHQEFPEDRMVLLLRQKHGQPEDIPSEISYVYSRLYPQSLFASCGTQYAAREVRPDFIFTHNFANPFGRSAVLIQDFLFLSNPEWFSLAERMYFRPMRYLAPHSTLTFSTSATEGRRFAQYGILNSQPVGLGVNCDLLAALPREPTNLKIRSQSFLLTVGRINTRKNLRKTIEACILTERLSADFPLVIVGSKEGRSGDLDDFQDYIDRGVILHLPVVSESTLAWLYGHASLFLYLSLDEGFGLPPIEAATFGCTVVVSDIDIFHETMGESAQYVDPTRSDEIADLIETSLQAPTKPSAAFASSHKWSSTVSTIRDAMIHELGTSA